MYLWRKRASPQWWIDNEEALRARFGNNIAVIERPDAKRIEIEIACESANELEEFGGQARKLPRDWLTRLASQQKTKPIRIKDRQLIIPAGTAFGTGEHATTAMCLTMLKRVVRPGDIVVDLGTGSGILALATRLLGAKRVIGIDNDAVAIRVAKENARRNKIDNVRFKVADVRRLKFPRKIDIVTANLFSELLIEILPKIQHACCLILSGVLREQERELTRALKRCKIDIVDVRRRGKWIAILAGQLRRS
jgi:ribosomal protein L11 methyltransferase